MVRNVLVNAAIAIGFGSFILLLNAALGILNHIQPKEVISLWVASALIGIVSALYYTKIPSSLVRIIQFAVGVAAYTTMAVLNEWITFNLMNIFFYAGVTFIIMLIIFTIFYLVSLFDSKEINEKLNEK